MQKLTRRQYEKFRAVLADALQARQSEVEAAINVASLMSAPVPMEIGDLINGMHDAVSAAEQAIKDLDNAWETRNWTAADWTTRSLIAQNID